MTDTDIDLNTPVYDIIEIVEYITIVLLTALNAYVTYLEGKMFFVVLYVINVCIWLVVASVKTVGSVRKHKLKKKYP